MKNLFFCWKKSYFCTIIPYFEQFGSTMKKVIDLDSVLRQRMGNRARWVPGILVSWLKHIVHEDELNHFLTLADGKVGSEWLRACLDYLDMTIEVDGMEHLPKKNDGRWYTFVSNHPLGGIDGIAIGELLGRTYDDQFRYLVNDLLMYLPGLAPLCIPINKTGKQSRNFPAMVEAGFKGENHIVMFPAGICSRQRGKEIHDLPWKKTFLTKSVETHRDIVPIHFSGANSKFFYRLANFSDRYIKKVNIAMLFLADEMFKNRGKTFRITIGEPIPYTRFDHSRSAAEWAQIIEEEVYQLPKNKII